MKKTLVIDVGGNNLKVLATGQKESRRVPSGPAMTARSMVDAVKKLTSDWEYDVISIGFPGPVVKNRPMREPANLAAGWLKFDFEKAFGKPVRMVNDAAMQALGSYDGGTMLFFGLGTGLGSAMMVDGQLVPMELAHLPYRKGKTYEDYLGDRGRKRLGPRKWARHVEKVLAMFRAAMQVDYIVLGGGNVKKLPKLPPNVRPGDNMHAFEGGFRLWSKD